MPRQCGTCQPLGFVFLLQYSKAFFSTSGIGMVGSPTPTHSINPETIKPGQ